MQTIIPLLRYTLLEALRNRFFWLLLILLIASFILAEFVGAISITETQTIKTSLLAATTRLLAIFTLCLTIISSMIREMNDKGLALFLALPVSRTQYYLARLFGFSIIALLVTIAVALLLCFYVSFSQVLPWAISLYCELLIMSSLSLLCVFTLRQITQAITAVMAFYLLSRTMASIVLMSQGSLIDPDSLAQKFIAYGVEALAFVLPDLNRFTSTAWLVYETANWEQIIAVIMQTIIYLILLSCAGLFDLYRKNI